MSRNPGSDHSYVRKIDGLYIPFDPYGRKLHRGLKDASLAYTVAQEFSLTDSPIAHIKCLETGVVYNGIAAVTRAEGMQTAYLLKHLRGMMKSCGGKHYAVVEEFA